MTPLIFDPLHYLALLERKTNALDQAAPLAGWELPEQFTCLRRLLEARYQFYNLDNLWTDIERMRRAGLTLG